MLELAHIRNARPKKSAAAATAAPSFTMHRLWRQALWGSIAAFAFLLAILAGFSDAGSQRFASLFSSSNMASSAPSRSSQQVAGQTGPRSLDTEAITRQLLQTVRGLADDRERMTMRLAAVERSVDDLSVSVNKQIEAMKAASAPVVAAAPAPLPASATAPASGDDPSAQKAPVTTASISATHAPPPASAESASPDSPAVTSALSPTETSAPTSRSSYGAELGNGSSIKALHARWAGIRSVHGQMFEGLRPFVALRDNPKSHRTELRLVVGPFANAAAAAQLCASLVAVQLTCQPTMYDGRSLVLE